MSLKLVFRVGGLVLRFIEFFLFRLVSMKILWSMADPEIKKIALIFKFIQVFCEMLKKSKLE